MDHFRRIRQYFMGPENIQSPRSCSASPSMDRFRRIRQYFMGPEKIPSPRSSSASTRVIPQKCPRGLPTSYTTGSPVDPCQKDSQNNTCSKDLTPAPFQKTPSSSSITPHPFNSPTCPRKKESLTAPYPTESPGTLNPLGSSTTHPPNGSPKTYPKVSSPTTRPPEGPTRTPPLVGSPKTRPPESSPRIHPPVGPPITHPQGSTRPVPPAGSPITHPSHSSTKPLPPVDSPITRPPLGSPIARAPEITTRLPPPKGSPTTSHREDSPSTHHPVGSPMTHAPEDSPRTHPLEGSPTTHPPEGRSKTHPPVGSLTSRPLEGLPTIRSPEGLPTIRSPEGLQTIRFPEGLPTIRSPEGLPTIRSPEGLPTIRSPEGLPTIRSPEGLPTIRSPEGLPTIRSPEGLPTIRSPEGLPTTSPLDRSLRTHSPVGLPTTHPLEGLPTTRPPEGPPRTRPPESSMTTPQVEGSLTTRPPEGSPKTYTPVSLPTTRPPEGSPRTHPAVGPPTTRPTEGLPTTGPPEGSPRTHPPVGSPTTRPPEGSPRSHPLVGSPTTHAPGGTPRTPPPVGSPRSHPPVGPPTTRPPEGSQRTHPPVGPPTTRPAEGSPRTYPPAGSPTNRPPESSPRTYPPVGSPTTHPPEGSPRTHPPVGSPTTRPEGSPTTPRPEGSLVSLYPKNSPTTPPPKGPPITRQVDPSSGPYNQKPAYGPPVQPNPLKTSHQQDPIWPQQHIVRNNFLADAWLKFRLLMWKNFLQQLRRPLQTAAEVLLPILTMTLVLLIRWQVAPANQVGTSYPAFPAYSLQYSMPVVAGMESEMFSIAYSPTSPILESIVMSAMATLIYENDKLLHGFGSLTKRIQPDLGIQIPGQIMTVLETTLKHNSRILAFKNSKELKRLYAEENITHVVLAAVEFDDMLYGATELPANNLTYSLRFPERPRQNSFYQIGGRDWKTDLLFPNYELPGPRFPFSYEGGNDPGYVNELFIALQHSISTELISRSTGQNIRELFTVMIQRYPHPPYWDDASLAVLKLLFPMFVMLSTCYSAINIVRAIVVEKEQQLKESMKIMGLPTWLHWTAWFWKQFLFQLFIAIIMIILLKVYWFTNADGFNNYAVFTHTPWTILMFFLLLYLTCMIFFCFMLSSFFSKGSTAALFTGVIWFLTFMPAFLFSTDAEISNKGQIISCLFINTAMAFGFQLLLARECSGGLQWGKFFSSPSKERSRFMFGHVVLMLCVDCVLFMLVTLYLEQVSPGPFGAPRPWYFPIQPQFWCPDRRIGPKVALWKKTTEEENKVKHGVVERSSEQYKAQPLRALYVSAINTYQTAVNVIWRNRVNDRNKDDYKIVHEKDPINHSIGVKIQNLTKVFGHNTVVNNLNLTVYNDQITVLLGHNGAGKTTTISMLTGNLQPTFGKVTVAGYNMSTQAAFARSHIGLCPQHNILFDELTVSEHLEFFSRLKGLTGEELDAEIQDLIKKLDLETKHDYQSKGLSGGQKRRLCVGIALSGRARVVLLDEPTSGMDPASRRGLWDLLQEEKKDRSMILTTHFMDEADILGDRVAIMAQGRLQCVGSPYFLKQHYGVGYTLVVVKDDNFDADQCTALITKYIPGTVIKEDRGSEVTYSLSNKYSNRFEDMLDSLEKHAKTIKFRNYGLLTTTLEDVFMSVGADLAPIKRNDHFDVNDQHKGPPDEHDTRKFISALEQFNNSNSSRKGVFLIMQRVFATWLKLALVWRASWLLVLMQFIVPTLLLNAALGLLQYIVSLAPTIKKRMLTLTKGFEQTETLLGCDSNSTVNILAAEAYQEMFEKANIDGMTLNSIGEQPINEYYLNRTHDPLTLGALRYRMLIGSTFSDDAVTAWFSNFGYHDVAVSLAAVHSALLKMYNPDSELTVYNHPLKTSYEDQTDLQMLISLLSMQLSTGIGSSVAIMTAVFIMFYIKERISGAKLLQRSAGIQPIVMWGSAAVYDFLWLLIFCLPIPISCDFFDVPGLGTGAEISRLWLSIMLYCASIIPLTYLLSLLFNGPALGFVCYFFLNVLLGMLGAQVVEALLSPAVATTKVADFLDAILQFHPLYCLVTCVRYLNQVGLREDACFQKCDFYKVIYDDFVCKKETLCEVDDNCCYPEYPERTWAAPGILRYLMVMLFTCVMFWIVLMVIEYGLLKQIFTRKKIPPAIDENTVEEDVAAEAHHAHKVYETNLANQALLALGLTKYYGKYLAVNQISFGVNEGECFGLLGVNGAGKTTTFKMLMGDESISSGEAFISGHSVEHSLYKVYENIGYCPQFDALFMELTGRETLRIFALMRGLRLHNLETISERFATALGFRKYLDMKVYQYSGGTRRKLNTAVAFLGKTRLIFVDEPTTGVDPAAKRHVWRAMRGVQLSGRGVVLTSHSMEECEALCSRLSIMVNGRFQCIGTPQHLKNKFSQGFTLTIKLKAFESKTLGQDNTARVKKHIKSQFKNAKLMEEYQGLLTYYLPDRTIAWSRMFGIMEHAKQKLAIEDYTIAQTTLEQIFLQFTKYQGHETATKMFIKPPDPTQIAPHSTLNVPNSTQKRPDSPPKQPDSTQKRHDSPPNQPDSTQKRPDSPPKQPDSTQKRPDSPPKQPDSTQKHPDSPPNQPDSTQKWPDSPPKQPDSTQKQSDPSPKQPDSTQKRHD